jgi:hypothetical protein
MILDYERRRRLFKPALLSGDTWTMTRIRSVAALMLGACLLAGGCSRTYPPNPKTYPVNGKILLPGGSPLTGGRLTFHSKDPDHAVIEPFAELEPDGSFKPTTFQQNDGLLPGTWVVTVSPRSYKTGGPRSVNADRIPRRYQDERSSPLVLEVKEEDNSPTLTLKD